MKDQSSAPCPTPTAHKRLQEIHRFWHECAEGYQDPEEFRSKLNACIQAARNLTFALQKEGNLIPGFDDWYPGWQEKMKADPVMRWLHNARTQIVHKGDLATRSQATVWLQIDYADAGREVAAGLPQPFRKEPAEKSPKFNTNPLHSLDQILDQIEDLPLPSRIRQESTITIERRWVDSDLPNIELLDALAHVYGFLSQLVKDAHDRAGVAQSLMIEIHGEAVPIPELEAEGGRLPCMITSRILRSASFHLVEGTPATGGKMRPFQPDKSMAEKAAKKYKMEPVRLDAEPSSPIDLIPMFIKNATAIAQSGEEHGWFIFFFRGITRLGIEALAARDASDKRILAQNIAEIVAANHIDGIVEIGEVWQAPMTSDPEGAFVRPAVHPERTEAISIWAETATGQKASIHIPIKRRRLRATIVGEPVQVDTESITNFFLEPVRRVWATWQVAETETAEASDQPGPDQTTT